MRLAVAKLFPPRSLLLNRPIQLSEAFRQCRRLWAMTEGSASSPSPGPSTLPTSPATLTHRPCGRSRRIVPPESVRGMVEFDEEKFTRVVRLPCLRVPARLIGRLRGQSTITRHSIPSGASKLRPVMASDESRDQKLLLFDLDADEGADVEAKRQIQNAIRSVINESDFLPLLAEDKQLRFQPMEFTLRYEDWSSKACLEAIVPEDIREGVSAFSSVGHIIQLNLREETRPYRWVIGRILHDKLSSARTVVNKPDPVAGEFRIIEPELLAGEPNYVTELWENGVRYRLDFSRVFWNSRLTSVHENVVGKLNEATVLFDAFCGVGPFVLPAVKKRRAVCAYANDLNPVAIEYLRENMRLNKIDENRVKTYNMDAADFIRSVIPDEFHRLAHAVEPSRYNFHVVMNLPALSLTFLPHFRGLLKPDTRPYFDSCDGFWMHCHFFVKSSCVRPDAWYVEEAERNVKEVMQLPELHIQELNHLRTVANNKEMFRATFRLPSDYVFDAPKVTARGSDDQAMDGGEPVVVAKKLKLSPHS